MLTQLDDSLQPLIEAFNQSSSKRRFVTLLSPTWPLWIHYGTRAVQKGILKPFPHAPLDLFVIWISMMEGDHHAAALKAVSKFKDERVKQFFDQNQLAGKAFAGSLGHRDKVAWDIYLFYPAKSMWNELPPQPEAYMHQLRDSWADQSCLFEKDQLRVILTEKMKDLFP